MERIGVRELRASVAATVRRAEAGQTTVITVGGRPVAQIGPVRNADAQRSIDELIVQGALIAPRRTPVHGSTHEPAGAAISVWGSVRLDRLLREVRG